MGFFGTMAQGAKIYASEAKLKWQQHGAQGMTFLGTGLMLLANVLTARRGASSEVQQAIANAEATIAEIEAKRLTPEMVGQATVSDIPEGGTVEQPRLVTKKDVRDSKFKLAKAKGKKYVNVGKLFWKEALVSATGAALVGAGQHMNTKQKTALATACAAVSAEFAAYRANVVADLGEDKDLQYMTTKTTKNAKRVQMEDGTVLESVEDDGMVTMPRDDSIFTLHYSRESCPPLWSDNLSMRLHNLQYAIDSIWLIADTKGYITLNDMRRAFARNADERQFDVPLGGVFGLIIPPEHRHDLNWWKNLHWGWDQDQDFLEGRKEETNIIFPCSKEPIINKINPKLMAVETGR